MLGFILRTGKEFEKADTMLLLYNSLVRPLLEYASTIWNPQYAVYVGKLEKIQETFLKHLFYRINTNKLKSDNSISLLSLKNRRNYLDQMFMYKLLNNKIDSPNLLSKVPILCPRVTCRKPKLFHVPSTRTKYADNAFISRACTSFNKNFSKLDPFHTKMCIFKKYIVNTFCE